MSESYWLIGSRRNGTQELIETNLPDEEVLNILNSKHEGKK